MHRRVLLGSVMAFVALPAVLSGQKEHLSGGKGPLADHLKMNTVVHDAPPPYPSEARKDRLEGRIIVAGQVDFTTGVVTSVRIEKSSGYKILDDAALGAFRKWRFKPGTVRRFRVPVTYRMRH